MAEAPLFNYDPNMVQGLNGINPMLYMMFPEYSAPPPITGDLMSLRSGQLGRDMDMQLLSMRQNAALSRAAKAQADADWQTRFAQASAGTASDTTAPEKPAYEPLPRQQIPNRIDQNVRDFRQLAQMYQGVNKMPAYGGAMTTAAGIGDALLQGRHPVKRPADLGSLGGKQFSNNMPVSGGQMRTPSMPKQGTYNFFTGEVRGR